MVPRERAGCEYGRVGGRPAYGRDYRFSGLVQLRSCTYMHDRRNWLFCWTEVGAKHAGIVQSLIATCRLHGIDPYTYLVDVLQRVGQHPASRVAELTPRLWKQHFADKP
jgi:transposase IS66-like protein